MPTYDFRCQECGHTFSEFTSIKDKDRVRCPACGGPVAQRFTGFVFMTKGGGGSSSKSCGTSCSTCSGCK